MSRAEIYSGAESATAQANTLERSASSFGGMSLQSISGASAGIPGDTIHDSTTALETGLRTWTDLIRSDADAIQTIGLTFDDADQTLTSMLLGM